MIRYATASLGPALLLSLASLRGGFWVWAALLSVTALVYLFDRLPGPALAPREDSGAKRAGVALSVTLALVHFPLLWLGVSALAGNDTLTLAQTLALGLALGMFFGQISNSNAHELIHAAGRWHRRLGTAVYVSLLFGHHASSHLKVHHVWVATPKDPNSAALGESLYRFLPRAWRGSFRDGLYAETALRARRRPAPARWTHPYFIYVGGAGLVLLVAVLTAGLPGLAALLVLAIYAQSQLLISDYVQHYGLRRAQLANGTPEPVGPAHSWNATPWYSSAMMLNAPRHSDHHVNPARAFPALRLDGASMPMLPSSFPVMGMLATCPPLWRRVMDRQVARNSNARVNLSVTDSGETTPDLAESDHVKNASDSDLPGRIAPDGAKHNERRGV